MKIIKAKNIYKVYKDGNGEVAALKGVDLEVGAGEFVAVTGRSGSGKSTLFHQLGLIDSPTSGQLIINQTHTSLLTEAQKTAFRLSNIGYIFQDYALIPTLSAKDNVILPLVMSGCSLVEAEKLAEGVLGSVGLAGRGHHLPSQLSGGQQQRVSIARAISHNPKIVLADEPTANLDHETSLVVMAVFRKLSERGITVIMITHEDDYAKLTDRVVTLFDGKIVSDVNYANTKAQI